jgi:hypothetical protein
MPDPEYAVSPDHLRAVGLLARFGLTYDLLLRPEQIEPATRLVDRYPDQRFVLDHMTKPDISQGELPPGTARVRNRQFSARPAPVSTNSRPVRRALEKPDCCSPRTDDKKNRFVFGHMNGMIKGGLSEEFP